MFVEFIQQDQHLRITSQHLGNRLQLGRAVHRAAGIAGAVEDQPARALADVLLHLVCRQLAALREAALYKHRLATVETHAVRKRRPIRRGHQHFIALVEGRGKGIEDDLLGTVGNHDGGQRIIQVVFALEFTLHGKP
ncbi:hypothetical protein D3C81_1861400 [compost metagenome]